MHQSQGKASLKTSDINHFFFPSTCFSLKRGFTYSWQHCVYVFSSLHIPVCIWCPPQSGLWTHGVFWETDERKWFIHQTRPRIQIPADLLIRWLILQTFPRAGCQATLIRAFSEAWCARHHPSRSDSLWQQTPASLTSEYVHIAAPNSNVKPNKELRGW